MSEPLVIIGNGMAAARLCEELSQRALGRYAIAVVGKEPRLAYNRVLLSSVLAGEVAANDLTVKPADWWRKHGVTLCYGTAATAVDAAARTVTLEGGTTLPFAKLVFATGSRAVRLPLPGADLPGVLTFRDLADTESLVHAARRGSRAVVIGGGLLGIEAAYGLAKAGVEVTLVHLMDRLMERQLDARAAALLKRAVEAKGIKVELEAATASIHGDDHVEAVELKDGRILPADTVVIAVGIAPNAEIAGAANLAVNRGIVVDDGLATSDPNIFAIGECAEHRGVCYGLVEPANEQARALAERFAGRDAHYTGSVNATNLKVSGVHVFSAGDFLRAPGTESIVLADAGLCTYRKLVIEGERLVGAVLYGDTADARWYLELLRTGASIEAIREDIVFGRAFAERKASLGAKSEPESDNLTSTCGLPGPANAVVLPPAHIVAAQAAQSAAHAKN
ncbi:MAG TPA: FAD-dependent oxidoreductase [Xanthobacteraceae bacterium]|jgi:nitrite reductase (NADH) large subunit|nr:FAD-dependent oxidoreductase [Xanthobacteraceae bacterium]